MPAQLEETLLESFRLGQEGLRNLDAILRDRCRDIDPTIGLEYEVRRVDHVTFSTNDVEDVLKERNGSATRIAAILVRTTRSPKLRLNIEFGDGVVLNAAGVDRARFLMLVSDLRNLVRESMQGRSSLVAWKRLIPLMWIIPTLVIFGLLELQGAMSDLRFAEHDRRVAAHQRQVAEFDRQIEEASSKRIERARQVVQTGSTDDKLSFLVEAYIDPATSLAAARAKLKYPVLPDEPWWQGSATLIVLVGGVSALVVYGFTRLIGRRFESLFMFGDEIARQMRRDRRREKIVWGVVAAFVVGVVASLFATLLTSG